MDKLNDQIITEKLKDIGLEVKSIKFLNDGNGGNKYVVKTHDEEKYILKTPKMFQEGGLQKQMDIMREINEKEIISIYPIHDKALNFGTGYGYVYKFIEGTVLGKLLKSKSYKITAYEIGKFIGRFHKLTKNTFAHKSSNLLVWKRLLKKLYKQVELIKLSESEKKIYPELKQDAVQLIESMSDILYNNESYKEDGKCFSVKGRTRLIHGDLHPGNIIVSDLNKWIIIDTDSIKRGNISHDITWYMTPLLLVWETLSIDENPKDHVKKFLSGYNSEYKLTKNEIKNIPLVLIAKLMETIVGKELDNQPISKLYEDIPKYKLALKSIILIME